jgi:hypothetical protein
MQYCFIRKALMIISNLYWDITSCQQLENTHPQIEKLNIIK